MLRLPDNRNQAARDTGALSSGMGRTGRAKNNSDAIPPTCASLQNLMIHIGYTPWHCRESPEAHRRGGQNAADSAAGGASWISVAEQNGGWRVAQAGFGLDRECL